MIKLSDFFQPLNFLTLLYVITSLVFFDIFGTFIKNYLIIDKKTKAESRLINWLIGLGIFIFIWFILGLFVEPNRRNVLISVVLILIFSFPQYLRNKDFRSLSTFVKPLLIPIILLVPFLPSFFVKASLPPYVWDEMAYHFASPEGILREISSYWAFYLGGLYQSVPRLMDTFYLLSFSVTHTYSVVRLLQFFILATSLFVTFLNVRKIIGWLPSVLFILIFLSLPIDLPYVATIGYVDAAAFSFLLLGLIFALDFLFSNQKDYLILSFIFWSMSVGTKYTTLTSFAAFWISFLLIYWFKNRSFKRLLDKATFLKISLLFVIFGGYWYIKNFIAFGNPIYPFFFPCWGTHASECLRSSSFFGNWTTQIKWQNLYPILKELLPQNIILHLALPASAFIVGFFGDKKNKLILMLLLVDLSIEFAVMKFFSGFDPRYQQYLIFNLILVIILVASSKFNKRMAIIFQFLIILSVIISSLFFYVRNVRYLNSLKFLNWYEINYALGRINIYQWVDHSFPEMKYAVYWCQDTAINTNLSMFDPQLIWTSYAGLMRVFLTNCRFGDPPIDSVLPQDALKLTKEKKIKFWLISISRCSNNVPTTTEHNGSVYLNALNNVFICNSTEVKPNLYYFDYSKIDTNTSKQ